MDLVLYVTVLTGFVCTTSAQSQTTRCLLDKTTCTTDFYSMIQKVAKDDPDSVKNDPNFGCSAADEYRKCLEDVTSSGCPEMDEGEYQQNVKSMSIKLNKCWTSGSIPSASVAVYVISLGVLSCFLLV